MPRESSFPHANGGRLLRDLRLPDFRDYAVTVPKPGAVDAESTRDQGQFIRDVIRFNPDNFRVFSPDETGSNRWDSVFDVTNRCSTAAIIPIGDHVAADGRVMEMLSEHQCEGWLDGYLLTGRHRRTGRMQGRWIPCFYVGWTLAQEAAQRLATAGRTD